MAKLDLWKEIFLSVLHIQYSGFLSKTFWYFPGLVKNVQQHVLVYPQD